MIRKTFFDYTYTQSASLQCGHNAGAAVGQLLGRQTGGEDIQIQATNVSGYVVVHQTQFPCLLYDGPRVLAGFVVLRCDGNDLLACELPRQLLELLLLLGQGERWPSGGDVRDGGIRAAGHQLTQCRRRKLQQQERQVCYVKSFPTQSTVHAGGKVQSNAVDKKNKIIEKCFQNVCQMINSCRRHSATSIRRIRFLFRT